MARKVRIEFPGACYHVINRGNYRRDLFAGKGAAESFQRCIAEAAERFGWRLHAFVIMRNHFHLAVETPEPNLSEGMKWLQGTWVTRFNRLRSETGRPFQGRYKALHVEPGHALAQVAHYIHLNPVRAKIVTSEQLLSFRWSSLPLLAGKNRPRYLEASTLLAESGGLRDSAAGWRSYRDYLGVLAEEDARRRGERFGRLSRGWAIGSADFKKAIKEQLAETGTTSDRLELLGGDREAHRQLRAELWEEKLLKAAAALGVALDQLPAQRSAAEKVELAVLLKATSSVSNAWLAERLQMGKTSSVSQYVRRFRLKGGTAKRSFKRALKEVSG